MIDYNEIQRRIMNLDQDRREAALAAHQEAAAWCTRQELLEYMAGWLDTEERTIALTS